MFIGDYLPELTPFYLCLYLFTYVHPCLLVFSCLYLRSIMFTYVYH